MGITQATLELLVTLKDEVSAGASSIGSSLGTIGTIAGGVALAGVAAFGAALISGVGDAQEAARINAATEQTIASMGNAAGVSAQHVQDFASSLSDAAGMSLFGDDQIQQSTNLLLTFGNIKGETLDLATALTTDLAQALGGAPADQAMMLGKALNDPIHGMTALGKAGLTFSEEQKAAITAMQDSGDMAGAQAIILAELTKQVGGQAEAAAKATGGWSEFQGRLGEAKETLGKAVLPVLGLLVGILNDHILPLVEQGAALFGDLVGGLTATGESTGFVADIMKVVGPIFSDIQAAAAEVFGTLMTEGKPILDDLGKIAMPALIAAGQILAGIWDQVLKPSLMATWDIFKNILLPAIREIIHVLSIVLPPIIGAVALVFTEVLLPAVNGIIQALGFVVGKVEEVIKWFQDLGNSLSSIQIPDWLQGHSPPPLANWFGDIAGAAQDARDTAGGIDLGANMGALPVLAGRGGGAGGVAAVNVYVTVQGSVTTQQDLVTAIRDGLVELGNRNLDIFGGRA